MLYHMASRRRILLLVAGCALPLFFIAATTSYFYPDYLPPTFHANPEAPISEPAKEPSWDFDAATTTTSHSTKPSSPPSQSHWTFDYHRDERNFGLSNEQCEAAFPGFFHEIDRAVRYREKVGQISRDDVDIEWRKDEIIRAMIYDRQVRIPSEISPEVVVISSALAPIPSTPALSLSALAPRCSH
jgi:hypothetical protein